MPLQASAEADYATLEAPVEAVQKHAFTEHYAIVKARSKSNRFENVVKAVLSCDRGERSSKEVKKSSAADTVAIMKAAIQTIDVQAILTRAGAKVKPKGAAILTTNINTSNDLIVNTDKTVIDVSSDEEFEALHV